MPSQTKQVKTSVFLLGGMIVSMTTAQIMLKLAGNYATEQHELLHSFVSNSWLWISLLASSIGMVCWLLTLRQLPLASAYPWTALIYVLTPLTSAVLFDDVVNTKYVIGMACIVAGVFFSADGVET